MVDPTQFLSNPAVALSLRVVLGGYVIFMARRFYADPARIAAARAADQAREFPAIKKAGA